MTVLAGIIGRSRNAVIAEPVREQLRRLISRNDGDRIDERGAQSWLMLKVDIGAFGAPALHEDQSIGSISMLAGEPLLAHAAGSPWQDRAADLGRMHTAANDAQWPLFASAAGTYCGAHLHGREGTLTLFGDKLGLRPLYYWSDERFVVYASSMRILEGLDLVRRRMDLRGVAEISCLGFPLGDRTAFEDIKTLRAGEIVRFGAQAAEHIEYWRWDRLEPPKVSGDALADEAHRRFTAAVARRAAGSRSELAFLSGGLDSRAIVAALRQQGIAVDSLNFAPLDSQDEVFARQAARALGASHHYLAKSADIIDDKSQVYNQREVLRWIEEHPMPPNESPRPRRVWSGDGGSVALGHVYLDPTTVELAQNGQLREAIDAFCTYNTLHLPAKIFTARVADLLASVPQLGIREELERLECADRGRAFHLFLMLNDQRRHMADLYENIDLGRIEFELPFFDAEFLELVLGSPVNEFLRHRFYMRWLERFQAEATSVPWQAYRGHEPCPLPVPAGLRYQWDEYHDRDTERLLSAKALIPMAALLASPTFPGELINRTKLRLIVWLTRLGIRDYGYLVHTATVFARYWQASDLAGSPTGSKA
jgi:asparagine synthase (glutamine-hydrolysing)